MLTEKFYIKFLSTGDKNFARVADFCKKRYDVLHDIFKVLTLKCITLSPNVPKNQHFYSNIDKRTFQKGLNILI